MSFPNPSNSGGIAQPHPLEATIKAENSRRVQARAAYSALAGSIAATDFDSLRRDPQRKIGGTFEKLQAVPKRKKTKDLGMSDKDLNAFLSAFSFDAVSDMVPRKDIIKSAK